MGFIYEGFMEKILAVALLGFTSLSTFANDDYFTGELLLGSTTQEIESSGIERNDGSDLSFGLRGTYNISSNVGIELSYQNSGEAEYSYEAFAETINENLASDSFNIGVKGILPLKNGVSLNARLGIAFWDFDVDITEISDGGYEQPFSSSNSGNDIYYGIGVQYEINEKFNIGLEYTLVEFSVSPFNSSSVDLELSTLALTAGFKF